MPSLQVSARCYLHGQSHGQQVHVYLWLAVAYIHSVPVGTRPTDADLLRTAGLRAAGFIEEVNAGMCSLSQAHVWK